MFGDLITFTGAASGLAIIFNVIGSSLYDVDQARRHKARLAHPYAKIYRQRPLVSVILLADGSVAETEHRLASVLKTSYRQIEVVVVAEPSQRQNLAALRGHVKSLTGQPIKLYAPRRRQPRLIYLKQAVARHAHGELILFVDSSASLQANTITRAVAYFNEDQALDILCPNSRPQQVNNAASLLRTFDCILTLPAKKANSAFNSNYSPDLSTVFYRAETYRALSKTMPASPLLQLGDKHLKIAYASDVITNQNASDGHHLLAMYFRSQTRLFLNLMANLKLLTNKQNPNHTILLVWLMYPAKLIFGVVRLVLPLVLAYFTFLAVGLRQPAFLLAVWLALLILFLVNVFEDSQLSPRQKAKFVLLAPIIYSWAYVTALAQYLILLLGAVNLFRASDEIA